MTSAEEFVSAFSLRLGSLLERRTPTNDATVALLIGASIVNKSEPR